MSEAARLVELAKARAAVEAAVAPVRAERDALAAALEDVQDALNDADGEPCTCGKAAYGPCAYCGPMMRAERKISAALREIRPGSGEVYAYEENYHCRACGKRWPDGTLNGCAPTAHSVCSNRLTD